jgi:hypothetical protein
MSLKLALFLLFIPVLLLGAIPRFDTTVHAEGLSFRLPRTAAQEAEEVLEIFRYWRQMPGSTTKEELECFDPEQLWRHEQNKGAWRDKAGNTYTLAHITTCKIPTDSLLKEGKEHVTREEYNAAYQNASFTEDDLADWLNDWTAETPKDLQPIKGTKNVRGIFCTTSNLAILVVYLRTDPEHPYVLIVNPVNDPPAKWKSTLSSLLTAFTPRKGNASNSKPAQGGWYSIEKPPYRIHTNLSQKNRVTLNNLLANIQAVRKAYTKVIPEPKGVEIPTSVIRIFPTHNDYKTYVTAIAPDLQWSAGLFSTTHRELLVSVEESADAKDRKARINNIAFHEGWHQYLFLITPAGTNIPIWFNEGLATYFEGFKVSANIARPPKESDRARQALGLTQMQTVEGLKAFMVCSRDAFYDDNRLDYYAMAWAVTTTLLSDKNPLFKNTLQTYYQTLCEGATPEEARDKVFTDEVLRALSDALPKHIKKHLKKGR